MQRVCFAIFVFAAVASAITRTANTGTVRWSNPASWSPTGIPVAGDDVEITSTSNVIFDTSTPRLRTVHISEGGSLRFDGSAPYDVEREFNLVAQTILVAGYLEIGREDCLFANNARITLINDATPLLRGEDLLKTSTITEAPYGIKMLAVYGNGRWEAHATGRTPTWTKLSASVSKNANTITVVDEVDWKIGDEIIIASTDFDPLQTERFRIVMIAGKTIILNDTLKYSHYGQVLTYDGYSLDMRAEVAVLTSNVVIEGDMLFSPPFIDPVSIYNSDYEVHFGGHTISIENSIVRLEGLEFKYMGQAGRIARYPVHWHHRGNAPGQYIKRCSIHDSFHRGVTVHDTNQVLVQDVVAFNVLGHSMYLEDGTETLNQFINNLAITSRAIGFNEPYNRAGFLLQDGCASNPPGLRASFLDNFPSGFWITNANNTFIGNHAVGHIYGFWIRVDLVFMEPAYPCGGCTCSLPRQTLETLYKGGLIMVDNVAHSNVNAGIWIKENWIPRTEDGNEDADEYIRGFFAYKNSIGLEIYGIGSVHFENIIAADNPYGITVDWERTSSTNWSKVLVVGETPNFGNPVEWGRSSSCSRVFPGQLRSIGDSGGIPTYGFKHADRGLNWDDVTMINMLPRCDENVNPIDPYPGGTLGWIKWPDRGNNIPPDRTLKNVKFSNTFMYRTRGQSAVNDTIILGDVLYQAGYLDVDGSFPCVTPGSYIFFNTPSIVSHECEYRSNWNMWVCPPIANGEYHQLQVDLVRQYSWSSSDEHMLLDWECNKQIDTGSSFGSSYYASIRTDKRYIIQFTNNYVPSGLRFAVQIPRGLPASHNSVETVLVLTGQYSVEFYDVTYNPSGGPIWTPSSSYQLECHCGVTYVKFMVRGLGVEVRPNVNASLTCDNTCGNPWPAPAPTGYTCSQNLVTNNKNFTTCNNLKPLTTTARNWVQRPTLIQYPISNPPLDIGVCSTTDSETEGSATMFVPLLILCIAMILFV